MAENTALKGSKPGNGSYSDIDLLAEICGSNMNHIGCELSGANDSLRTMANSSKRMADSLSWCSTELAGINNSVSKISRALTILAAVLAVMLLLAVITVTTVCQGQ